MGRYEEKMRLYITGLAKVILDLKRSLDRQEKFSRENPLGKKLLSDFKREMWVALALDNSNVRAAIRLL